MQREFRQIVTQARLGGERLLVGVSGGVDSVVLLDLLASVAPELDLELMVLHVDHCIRPESAADAEFVMGLCRGPDIPCRIETVDVPKLASERGLSLEAAGREARRELLQRWSEEHNCRRIVLAHHRGDQAETFLQRLLRGSGLSGLQAMRVDDGRYWRPLLSFSRGRIEAYARERQLEWVEDASNADPQFLRNRIRLELLPQLAQINPRIDERLAALCLQLQREEEFWRQQVEQVWPQVLLTTDDGLRLGRTRLLECHPALRLRLLREALRRLRGDLQALESVHIEALDKLLRTERSQAELDLPGCWAARRYNQLWLRLQAPKVREFDVPLLPGEPLVLPDGRVLVAELCERAQGETDHHVEFDAALLRFPLQVRSPQPGDRFVPSGMAGRRKVKDLLIDLKLEKEQRRSLPLLLCGDRILWLAGLRRSALAPVTRDCRKVLVVRLVEGGEMPTKTL